MSEQTFQDGKRWQPAWTQAMTDFRGDDEEPPFDDVTVRMAVPASIGGSHVRAELSNRFGDESVLVGRGAITVGERSLDIAFDARCSTEIPAGESRWTDPIELTAKHGDDVVVDLYLPRRTPYATANGFTFERSTPGDFVGSREFPLHGSSLEGIDESRELPASNAEAGSAPDGTGWSLPPGGPFLRTIEVLGVEPNAVMVCLGSSSTAMGWPQYTAACFPQRPGSRSSIEASRETGSFSMHHRRPHRGAGPGCLDSMRTCSEPPASRTWSSPTTATIGAFLAESPLSARCHRTLS